MKRFNPKIAIPVLIIIAAAALMFFTPYFEVSRPDIKPSAPINPVGLQKVLTVDFADDNSGLSHLDLAVFQDGKGFTLTSLDFPEKGLKKKTVTVELNPVNLKLHEGAATVVLTAVDHSIFKNTSRLTEQVSIDLNPPQVSILSSAHNISPGGTCLVIYKISKDVEKSGVWVGQDYFPGYAANLGGKPCYLAYFPIPLDPDKGMKISLSAKDRGGNEAIASLPYHLKPKKFKKDTVEISENFLSQKMPEFQQRDPNLQGKSHLETFIYVNETMRAENFRTIQGVCAKTSSTQLWQGPFLRMKNAAPMAGFGDMRTYTSQKKKIGASTHLGVDLASTAHAPIEAANSGTVAFTGYLGIYGNAAMIDHGFGVFSLYAHMNEIKVKEGQQVAKGDVIGASGVSGLAGGDHLHFSVLVGGRFVSPIEWWDSHWIADNVDKKLAEAAQLL